MIWILQCSIPCEGAGVALATNARRHLSFRICKCGAEERQIKRATRGAPLTQKEWNLLKNHKPAHTHAHVHLEWLYCYELTWRASDFLHAAAFFDLSPRISSALHQGRSCSPPSFKAICQTSARSSLSAFHLRNLPPLIPISARTALVRRIRCVMAAVSQTC